MQVKYFVDEYSKVRSSDEDTGNSYTYFHCPTTEAVVFIVSRLTGNILYEFKSYNSLLELENTGVNTTPYRLSKFLKELTNLNEKSATIGAGKLTNIKEQAQYLLDKLNKEQQ